MSFELAFKIIKDWIYPAVLVVFFFGLTVFIHEFGHFLVAKRRKMKIDRFSIGFGPKIFGWTKDGIEYQVAWIPFGGYVALPQMTPAEMLEGKSDTDVEKLPPASPGSKIMVALAGPVFNIAAGVLLACAVWQLGAPMPINTPVVGWVEPGSAEETMDIKPGDRVVLVNDTPVRTWTDVMTQVALNLQSSVRLTFERNRERFEHVLETENSPRFGIKMINLYGPGRPYTRKVLPGTPAERAGVNAGDRFLTVDGIPVHSAEQLRDLIGKQADKPTVVRVLRRGQIIALDVTPEISSEEKVGRMGVLLGEEYELQRPGPTPIEQIREVLQMMGHTVYMITHAKQTGVGPSSLSGPVGIFGGWWYEVSAGGIMRGVKFAVLINVALAVFNLLPIPVLDGGHIVFAFIEAVRRKPINAKFVHATWVGSATLLIAFMLYVTYHDILRFMPWRAKQPEAPAPIEQPAPQP